MDNQIDTTTGTIRLRAVFPNADDRLFPNQFVNVRLNLSTLRNATVVPSATIQRASFGTFVYAIKDDGKATVRRVTLGPTEGERVAITEGVAPGERIVLEGVDALREGIAVEVMAARRPTRRRSGGGPGGARLRRERGRVHERLPPVHPPAGRDGAADGGAVALGSARLSPAAGVGAAAGGLPDDPGADVLPGGQSRRHDQRGDGAARAAVRPDSRPRPDVLVQFRRRVGADVALLAGQAASRSPSRKCRRRSTPRSLLPNDLPQPPIYNKVNPADTPVLTLAITSPTTPLPAVYDLVDTRVAQKLAQLPGVGLVSIAGGQRPAVRIQANPQALAAHNLNLQDLRAVIAAANVNQPKGNFDGPERSFMLDANDQLRSVQSYRDLIIAYSDGAPLRLSDVADVVDGAENTRLSAWADDLPAVLVNMQRQPGANVIEVVDRVRPCCPSSRRACRKPCRWPS